MKIYYADCIGRAENSQYPHPQEITDEASLAEAVSHDYVCAEYEGNHRGVDHFLRSDCLVLDFDNDHSENPEDWVTPEKVKGDTLSMAAR